MRRIIASMSLLVFATQVGCDNTRTEEKAPDKGKTAFDLKQTPSTKATQAELEEARRKAGFKSNDEVMAEAKAKYDRDSKVYIKEHLKDYRKLLDDVRKKLEEVEKAAPKWAAAKDGAGAFESWNEKYKKEVSKLIKGYDELTKKGSEGGNTQAQLGGAIQAWEDLGRDLGPEISKQDAFGATVTNIRTQLDAVGKILDEIEKDETLAPEPDTVVDAKADAKADDAKADAKADDKKADAKADDKKADDKKAG